MGTKRDAKRRRKVREDTQVIHSVIEKARQWIFGRGYRIKSRKLNCLLEPLSLLPTRVSRACMTSLCLLNIL